MRTIQRITANVSREAELVELPNNCEDDGNEGAPAAHISYKPTVALSIHTTVKTPVNSDIITLDYIPIFQSMFSAVRPHIKPGTN